MSNTVALCELASRHQANIIPVVNAALKEAVKTKPILMPAVTIGPGLMGSLLVGVSCASPWSQHWAFLLLE